MTHLNLLLNDDRRVRLADVAPMVAASLGFGLVMLWLGRGIVPLLNFEWLLASPDLMEDLLRAERLILTLWAGRAPLPGDALQPPALGLVQQAVRAWHLPLAQSVGWWICLSAGLLAAGLTRLSLVLGLHALTGVLLGLGLVLLVLAHPLALLLLPALGLCLLLAGWAAAPEPRRRVGAARQISKPVKAALFALGGGILLAPALLPVLLLLASPLPRALRRTGSQESVGPSAAPPASLAWARRALGLALLAPALLLLSPGVPGIGTLSRVLALGSAPLLVGGVMLALPRRPPRRAMQTRRWQILALAAALLLGSAGALAGAADRWGLSQRRWTSQIHSQDFADAIALAPSLSADPSLPEPLRREAWNWASMSRSLYGVDLPQGIRLEPFAEQRLPPCRHIPASVHLMLCPVR